MGKRNAEKKWMSDIDKTQDPKHDYLEPQTNETIFKNRAKYFKQRRDEKNEIERSRKDKKTSKKKF